MLGRRSPTPASRRTGTRSSLVSHQLPIWTVRSILEGRRLWHDPRKRQCTLASLTSLSYDGDDLVSITTPSRPRSCSPRRPRRGAGADRAAAGRRGAWRPCAVVLLGDGLLGRRPELRAAQADRGDGQGYVSGDGSIEHASAARAAAQAGRPRRARRSTASRGRPREAARQGRRAQRVGTWCPPCQAEAPRAAEGVARPSRPMHSRWSSGHRHARQRRHGARVPSRSRASPTPRSTTATRLLILALQGKAPTPPTTLVLDRQGRVAARVVGEVTAADPDRAGRRRPGRA